MSATSVATVVFGISVDPDVSLRTTDAGYARLVTRSATRVIATASLTLVMEVDSKGRARWATTAAAPAFLARATASVSVASPTGRSAAPMSMHATKREINSGRF